MHALQREAPRGANTSPSSEDCHAITLLALDLARASKEPGVDAAVETIMDGIHDRHEEGRKLLASLGARDGLARFLEQHYLLFAVLYADVFENPFQGHPAANIARLASTLERWSVSKETGRRFVMTCWAILELFRQALDRILEARGDAP